MKRQSIMSELGNLLSQITMDNGFTTEIGENSHYWQDYSTEFGSDALVYRDVSEDTIEKGMEHENVLHIEIEGRKFSNTPGVAANNMLQDIIKALKTDLTLSNQALKVFLIGNETDVETEGRTCAKILVKIDVLYRTRMFDP